MLIQPNSTINILKNVPLDNTYNHTLWFDNVSAQTTYFASMTKYTFPVQTYQRVNRGVMRLNRKADDIYDCNYLMFQNTSYGNKWFYAFISAIEYVNDATCEITFSIDPMQTYLFDIELKMCFVEREHSSTDVAGDNIINEPISTGDITMGALQEIYMPENYSGVIACTPPLTGSAADAGGIYSGLFSGVDYKAYALNNASDVTNFKATLANYSNTNSTDNVISVFMMPSDAVQAVGSPIPKEIASVDLPKPTTLGTYTPRNKKLLTYPFNYMVVDGGKDSGVYRYEWFQGSQFTNWTVHGITTCNPQIMAIPRNYCGLQYNYPEGITFDGFPQIAYTIDSYRAYLAQSSVGSTARGLDNAFDGSSSVKAPLTTQIGVDIGTGNFSKIGSDLAQPFKTLFQDLLNLKSGNSGIEPWDDFKRAVESSKHPNKASGTPTAEISVALRLKGIYAKQMCVQRNYAEVIDNFFDMFGYATNRIKIPNRTVRPHWNYVKTNGCDVVGNAPADDIRAVCKIYDKGVTFWKNPSEVGNYSLNNSL